MAKFAQDEIKHDPSNGQFAPGTATSSGDHAAAHEYHKGRQAAHEAKARELGESLSKPGVGSHAAAASHHGSAAYYHGAAAETNGADDKKKALRASAQANSASKKIAKAGAGYSAEKQNNHEIKVDPAANSKRIAKFLSQKWL